jgi:TolB protein
MRRTRFGLLLTAQTFVIATTAGCDAVPDNPAAQSAPARIAFSRIGSIRTGLFTADADGRNEKPLLSAEGLDYNASFSADGQEIIFTSERGGSADIYRVRTDGTALERLTSHPAYDDQAALSPDGSALAFVSTRRSGTTDIWLLDLIADTYRNLTDHGNNFRPSWSPDGKWLAFTSDRDTTPVNAAGRWEFVHSTSLYVIGADGTGLRRLTPPGGFAGSPKWSPDGQKILYYEAAAKDTFAMRSRPAETSVSQIVSIEVSSGAREQISMGPGIKLSPQWVDAHGVAFVTKWGSDPGFEFTSGEKGIRGEFRNPAWSADGEHVVYHKQLAADRHRMTPTFSRAPEFELMLTDFFTAFSPSGDQVVMSVRSTEPAPGDFEESSLEIMRMDGSDRRAIFAQPGTNALAPSWSPTGDQIAFGVGTFFIRPGTPARLALIKPDGSDFRLITSGEIDSGFPSWSPDGTRLVYRADGKSGRGLMILSLADDRITPLTTGPQYDTFPQWSPRGDRITFTSNRSGDFEIYTIRPDGTDVVQLTDSPGNDSHSVWSLDGEEIAFSSSRTGFKDEAPLMYRVPQPYGQLFVMRDDGSDVRQLTDSQWEDALPAWVPEERW